MREKIEDHHVGIGTDGSISMVVVDDQFREDFRKFIRGRKAKGIAAPGEDENVFMFVPDLNTPRKLETSPSGCRRAATATRGSRRSSAATLWTRGGFTLCRARARRHVPASVDRQDINARGGSNTVTPESG